MKKLIYGVVAVAGSVVFAGANAAETSEVRGYEQSETKEVAPPVRTSAESSKPEKWSIDRHPNPHVDKEETKDLMRAKRPK